MIKLIIGVVGLLLIITSCNKRKPVSEKLNIYDDSANTSKVHRIADEDFFIFLRDFSISPDFQKSRIKFPLEDCSLNTAHNIICNTITSQKWSFTPILDTVHGINSINVIYDNFKKQLRNTDERVYAFQGIENDISNYYYFKRIDGKWYLVKREDFSY